MSSTGFGSSNKLLHLIFDCSLESAVVCGSPKVWPSADNYFLRLQLNKKKLKLYVHELFLVYIKEKRVLKSKINFENLKKFVCNVYKLYKILLNF